MAMFGRQRDVQLFNSVNQELIHDIIEQLVGYYKVMLNQTPANVYGEAQNKTYLGPILIPCLLVRGGTTQETDTFGPDTFRELEVRFWKDDLISANVVPEIGDIILWNNLYFEVDNANENQLVSEFGKPTSTNIVDFLSAANFLGYSSPLLVVRVANTALNATTETATGSGGTGTGQLIKNDDAYVETASFNIGPFIAKYAGALGNSLKVSTCATSTAYTSTLTGTYSVTAGSTTVTGAGTSANTEMRVGDFIVLDGRSTKVTAIANTTSLTIGSAHLTGASAATGVRRWEFFGEFDSAPRTSTAGTAAGATNDELHVVVVDKTGDITGTAGTVLEKYAYLSKGSDAEFSLGSPSYWRKYLSTSSNYIFGGSAPSGIVTTSTLKDTFGASTDIGWDQEVEGIAFGAIGSQTYSLSRGVDYNGSTKEEHESRRFHQDYV